MSTIPKIETRIYGGEAEDIFNMLCPYIERAGYTWHTKLDKEGFTIITIEKNNGSNG